MGRVPCCEKDNVKRGQWTPEEDNKLSSYIAQHGTRNWRLIPKNAGLQRCGKSCRLRWTNYLRPDLKHEEFTEAEEQVIIKLHSVVGNRWSLIAAQLPGRTDNDVKNHWNTKLKKKLSGMGIDPVTHKPFSHLMAEITTTLAPPQVAHLAEAALGCFKDEMLHLLTKNRVDLMAGTSAAASGSAMSYDQVNRDDKEGTIQRIKLGLSRAMQETSDQPSTSCKQWALLGSQGDTSDGFVETSGSFLTNSDGFVYGAAKYRKEGEESAWSQSTGTASTCTGGAVIKRESRGNTQLKGERDDGEEANDEEAGRKDDFETDCVLWDLADDLIIE